MPPPTRAQSSPFVWVCFSALGVRSAALPTLTLVSPWGKGRLRCFRSLAWLWECGAGCAVGSAGGSPVAGLLESVSRVGQAARLNERQSLVPHPVTLPGEHLLLILPSRRDKPVLFHSFLIVSR